MAIGSSISCMKYYNSICLIADFLGCFEADDEAGLTWPDSSTVVYVTGVDTYADIQNGVKNVTILPNVIICMYASVSLRLCSPYLGIGMPLTTHTHTTNTAEKILCTRVCRQFGWSGACFGL